MSEDRDQTRRDQILDAAIETIGQYGYKRTSMDDIATVVGISRPALYQVFRNKADIYRAGIQRYCDESMKGAAAALDEDHPLEERLRKAFDVTIIAPHRMIETMPHGVELLSQKQEIGQDLMDKWSAKFGELLRETFEREPGLSPDIAVKLAATVMNVVTGLKARGISADETSAEFEKLLGLVRLMR